MTDSSELSLIFRLIIIALYMLMVIHLISRRITELGRKDYISKFRKWLFIILVIVLASSIPVFWYTLSLLLGNDTEALRTLATITGGFAPLALVVGLEIGDIVIKRTNKEDNEK